MGKRQLRHSNVKSVENNNHKTHENKALSFFWFLFKDFNISNIFYKIQNLKKWQLVSVITHWTYTCLNPWALRKKNHNYLQTDKVYSDWSETDWLIVHNHLTKGMVASGQLGSVQWHCTRLAKVVFDHWAEAKRFLECESMRVW